MRIDTEQKVINIFVYSLFEFEINIIFFLLFYTHRRIHLLQSFVLDRYNTQIMKGTNPMNINHRKIVKFKLPESKKKKRPEQKKRKRKSKEKINK